MYQKSYEEEKVLEDVREITKSMTDEVETPAQTKTTLDVLRALNHRLVLEMVMKGIDPHKQIQNGVEGKGRNLFYKRLQTLKEVGLVHRKKQGEYELTHAGTIIQEAIRLIDKVIEHSTELRICDVVPHDHGIPETALINSVVTDLELREILLEKRVRAGDTAPKRYVGLGSGTDQ